jgi:hypothetical protein
MLAIIPDWFCFIQPDLSPELNSHRGMFQFNFFASGKFGDSSGYFEDLVVSPCREAKYFCHMQVNPV